MADQPELLPVVETRTHWRCRACGAMNPHGRDYCKRCDQ